MSNSAATERRVNLGVVGVGSHCCRTILPVLAHLPFELSAVCDLDADRAGEIGRRTGSKSYSSLGQMIRNESLEAVLLVAGPRAHPSLAAEALDAGLHVWMEKPPCFYAKELEPLFQKRGDRVVVVGFKKAFMPATDKVVEILSEPSRGPLRSVLGVYPIDVPENGRQVWKDAIYTNWLGNGCHPLSQIVAVAGPVVALTVTRSRHGGGFCLLEFQSGAVGTLHLASGAPASQPVERYQFVGNGCQVMIENGDRVTFQRGIPFQYGKSTSYVPEGFEHGAIVWEPQNHLATLENRMLFTQGFYGELKYFYDCVVTGNPAERGSLEFALHLTRLYEAALLSEGKRIEVEQAG